MMEKISLSPDGKHATMADVAKAAGVSIKSVSRVINAEPHVTPKLREKVEAAIKALDYVPDTAARSLAGARSFTIGVLFDNPSQNYTMRVLAGAYRACVERQYHLRFDHISSELGEAAVTAHLDRVLRHARTDGFVVTPPLVDNPQVLDTLEAHGVRYVRIAPLLDPERSMAVSIDDRAAAAAVADLMFDKGHRRIGLINGPPNHGAAHTRRQGFIERLHARDPSIVVAEAYGAFQFEGGISAALELLTRNDRPTAIFAANDDSAAGAIVACNQLNLTVPTEISICGFDDSALARTVWPYLTTVHQPIEDMAQEAAMMLLDRSKDGETRPVRKLDFALIERASVSSPN